MMSFHEKYHQLYCRKSTVFIVTAVKTVIFYLVKPPLNFLLFVNISIVSLK